MEWLDHQISVDMALSLNMRLLKSALQWACVHLSLVPLLTEPLNTSERQCPLYYYTRFYFLPVIPQRKQVLTCLLWT